MRRTLILAAFASFCFAIGPASAIDDENSFGATTDNTNLDQCAGHVNACADAIAVFNLSDGTREYAYLMPVAVGEDGSYNEHMDLYLRDALRDRDMMPVTLVYDMARDLDEIIMHVEEEPDGRIEIYRPDHWAYETQLFSWRETSRDLYSTAAH